MDLLWIFQPIIGMDSNSSYLVLMATHLTGSPNFVDTRGPLKAYL